MREMKFLRFYFLDLKLSQKANGFSLMELMVAIGILAVISIMIFAKYPELSQRMALKRTSEEIALIARQAQAYALGIKRSAFSGDDYYGFGINFDKSDPKSLILFADFDSDETYDAKGGCDKPQTECFQEYKIGTGDYISELEECDKDGVCSPVDDDTLGVVYPRATSLATITADSDIDVASYARVTIKSPGVGEKYIKIWISGQISVE